MTIKVTKKDILTGRPQQYICPIALAAGRAGMKEARVSETRLFCFNYKKGKWLHADLPGKAIRFIIRFDAGRTVKPFSFTIETPK